MVFCECNNFATILKEKTVPGKTFRRICECDSFDCALSVELPLNEAQKLQEGNLIFMVKDCRVGPNPTDTLVEEHATYSLYSE